MTCPDELAERIVTLWADQRPSPTRFDELYLIIFSLRHPSEPVSAMMGSPARASGCPDEKAGLLFELVIQVGRRDAATRLFLSICNSLAQH